MTMLDVVVIMLLLGLVWGFVESLFPDVITP